MGTLGQYLRDARVAKNIDLRDAAQQTRIGANYLQALETENFAKLPGEVFVKGFLKNYCKFLKLDENEVIKRYAELKPQKPVSSGTTNDAEKTTVAVEQPVKRETPVEAYIWSAVITVALLAFLFTSLPAKHQTHAPQTTQPSGALVSSPETSAQTAAKSQKLYLTVIALEDTWLLVRIDASPQKKAVLKKGENLIWSASERFMLSYGRLESVKLLLNGEELPVKGARGTVVRDIVVIRSGILNQPVQARQTQPVRKKAPAAAQPQQAQSSSQPRAETQASSATQSPVPAVVLPVPAEPAAPVTPAQ
jgi:hypothetical protein